MQGLIHKFSFCVPLAKSGLAGYVHEQVPAEPYVHVEDYAYGYNQGMQHLGTHPIKGTVCDFLIFICYKYLITKNLCGVWVKKYVFFS